MGYQREENTPPVVEDARPYEPDSDDSMSMDSEEDVEMTGISRL
jgi:exosome complex component RRP4